MKLTKSKRTKKLKTALMTASLLTAAVPGISYAAEPVPSVYADQSSMNSTLQEQLQKASKNGFIVGDSKGQFRPEDSLTRQELALLLTRAMKLPTENNSIQSAIDAVQKAGIMQGYGNGFYPGQPVSRQELATVLVRVIDGLKLKGGNNVNTSDTQGTSNWASQYVTSALRLGLLPSENGSFEPSSQVERQDVLSVMLDMFVPRQETKTITKISGDIIVLDGVPFIATDKWKKLLSENNAEALEGAIIKYDTLTRGINELGGLEIIKNGTADKPLELHAEGVVLSGVLSISGNNVSIKGNAETKLGEVVVKEGVSTVKIDTAVDKLVVASNKPVTIIGNGAIGELALGTSKSTVTIDDKLKINDVTLPKDKAPGEVITNYKDDTSTKVNGVPPVKPASDSNRVNHSPEIVNSTGWDVTIGDEPTRVLLSSLFTDPDGDHLSYTLTKAVIEPFPFLVIDSFIINTPVIADPADVKIEDGYLVIDPKIVGNTTISIEASDGQYSVKKDYPIHVKAPNHAPVLSDGAETTWNYTEEDIPSTIDLNEFFEDEDLSDLLTFEIVDNNLENIISVSSVNEVATYSLTGNQLVVTPVSAGEMGITIKATDLAGESVTQTFTIKVTAAGGTEIPTDNPGGGTGTETPTDNPGGGSGTETPTDNPGSGTGTETPTDNPGGGSGTETPTDNSGGGTGTETPTDNPGGDTGTETPTDNPGGGSEIPGG
ncbi:S-layer homology domain-containing protein [Paenibacillus sp. sgz500958]|uniref:S-layer homology domain-containing protein n=1 Tax=Paenibacillus sp. sgz500958 TaxID=3242475 RepID=UPI0036D305B5